ncbi:glycosyltransferase [Proteus mirabilis]
MKIFIIITGLGMGGAERSISDLADKFTDLNHEVFIISLTGETIVKPKNPKIRIIELKIKKNPLSIIKGVFKIKKMINHYKPDIIHSHMVHANIFSRIMRLFIKFPVLVCTAHSKNEGGKLRMFIYRITDRLANISTNVSQEAVNNFISLKATKKGRMIPFYNGIDINKYHYNEFIRNQKRKDINISKSSQLILAVGRLTEAKDYPNLFHAISKLNHPIDIKLVIIGDGEDKEKLKKLAKQLNIAQHIIWLGIRHDVEDWMSACDLFVLSSAWEGFGLVVAEAMACERLVIGTNAGGVSEVISKHGFIVPTNDSDALSSVITKCLSLTPQEKNAIGTNARKHILNNFSLEKVSNEWIKLYTNLLK